MSASEAATVTGVRNGSGFPVPKGTEFKGGRPAVMSDEDLVATARQLNERLGRPPRADELITESGGCQRKRALSAINELKLELAQRAVVSQLMLPPAIEQGMRSLFGQWMQHAAAQLAAQHLDHSARTEDRLAAQQAMIAEQQESIALLRQSISDRERMAAELTRRARELESDLAASRERQIQVQSVADERLRLLNQLEALTPPPAATPKVSAVES